MWNVIAIIFRIVHYVKGLWLLFACLCRARQTGRPAYSIRASSRPYRAMTEKLFVRSWGGLSRS